MQVSALQSSALIPNYYKQGEVHSPEWPGA